ncbi:MAG: hypothetical protein Q8908_06545, partial [Bacteroidota bacterium]|nr:hypothetical protein [Bacteroidota bacterium]
MNKSFFLSIVFLYSFLSASVQCLAQNRWKLDDNGSITWKIDNRIPHDDHIEMSGKKVSVVLRYGVNDQGAFTLSRTVVWPMLRRIPNVTQASLMRIFNSDLINLLIINGKPFTAEKVNTITLNGLMTVSSTLTLTNK